MDDTRGIGLERHLSLVSATALLVGGVVGSGIFLVPGEMLSAAGSVRACLLVWIFGGIISFFGGLTFAELGSMLPHAGGEYVYLRAAYGQGLAFVYGWVVFAVIQSGSIAAVAVAFGEYAQKLFGAGSPTFWGCLAIVVTGAINLRTARVAVALQTSVTVLKCLALLAVCSLAMAAPGAELAALARAVPGRTETLTGIGLATMAALWAYDGWNAVSLVAGEVVEPVRNLPRALIHGLTIVVVLYLVTQVAFVACLGPENVAGSLHLASDVGRRALGSFGERFMAALIALSTFGTVLGMMLTCPRMYYAMAHDGVFLGAAGRVHPRWGTPHVAVALQVTWSLVLAAGGSFDRLLSYVMFATWLFYGLTAASVIVLRRQRDGKPGPFATPGYPWTVLGFLASSVVLMLNCFHASPRESLLGMAMLVAGIPIYFACAPRSDKG